LACFEIISLLRQRNKKKKTRLPPPKISPNCKCGGERDTETLKSVGVYVRDSIARISKYVNVFAAKLRCSFGPIYTVPSGRENSFPLAGARKKYAPGV